MAAITTCFGEFDGICIITDCEPDDALAICVLRKFVGPDAVKCVIVTESDVDKRPLGAALVRDAFPHALVARGAMSLKTYPSVEMSEAANVVLDDTMLFDNDTDTSANECIVQFLRAHENPLFICIAPPRDLLNMYEANTEIFNDAALLFYGGFNARTLTATEPNLAAFFNTAFKKVFFYESRSATGSANTVGAVENPAFFHVLQEHAPHVLAMLAAWNRHMGKKQALLFPGLTQDLMQAYLDGDQDAVDVFMPQFHRTRKHICTLIDNKDKTILLADWAAVLAAFHPQCPGIMKAGVISFAPKSGYTTWAETEKRGCVVWPQHIGRTWVLDNLISLFT